MDAMDLLERALEGVPEQTLEIVGADGARQAQPLSRGGGAWSRFALYPGRGADALRLSRGGRALPPRRGRTYIGDQLLPRGARGLEIARRHGLFGRGRLRAAQLGRTARIR